MDCELPSYFSPPPTSYCQLPLPTAGCFWGSPGWRDASPGQQRRTECLLHRRKDRSGNFKKVNEQSGDVIENKGPLWKTQG
jgi:hypothetical protein